MQVVKVKAPGHFAAFCVAINEPFYYLNGAFYLLQWKDAEAAKTFCGDNGVRACDLQAMAFSEVELVNLAAYRKELNEYGEVGCSREAFIEDYICQHS